MNSINEKERRNNMVDIIIRNKRRFSEKYIRPGGIEAAEKDGISKSEMMQEINHMTDRGISIDQRRDIVTEFVDREKGK